MKIRTKLIINMLIGAVALWSVVITSVLALRFIDSKLSYLTSKSTPYQIRTIELQKELQGAIADLVKLNSAKTQEEFGKFKAEAEKSLATVKSAQGSIEEMSNSKLGAYEELSQIANELYSAASTRITSDKAANDANEKIAKEMKESSARLKELDKRIRALQAGRSSSFAVSMKDNVGHLGRLRSLEELRSLLKDIQPIIITVQGAQKASTVIIARGKLNAVLGNIGKNEYYNAHEATAKEIKGLTDRLSEFMKLQSAHLSAKDDEAKAKAAGDASREVAEKMNDLQLAMTQEATISNERVVMETQKQGNIYGQSNTANSILLDNSELVSLALMVEGQTNRLFNLETMPEIEKLDAEIQTYFAKISEKSASVEKSLVKLGAREEVKILRGVTGTLSGIRKDLTADNGIVATLKKHISANEQAIKSGTRLREIVLKQSEKGRETVTVAKGEQEKAIASVNKVVKLSVVILLAFGCAAAVVGTFFGLLSLRSVIKPLSSLVELAERVAAGQLSNIEVHKSRDEFGQVHGAMEKMVHSLRDMIGRIVNTTSTLASSSGELASTAVELEHNSEVQVSGIETTLTAMTEMVQTIQDVSNNASHTSDSAGQMKEIAIDGQKALVGTSRELFEFAEIVRQSAAKTEALGQRSEAINDIVQIIKDIADQTNLLALNASIEAARAGEMGRGFSVVADSVKQLAQRTIESSDEISRTVTDMQREVNSSVVVMNKERDSILGIIEHIDGTMKSMDQIVKNVEEVSDMVQNIAAATEEQSSTAEDVNRTMVTINDVACNLTASVEKIKGTSENFASLSRNLQEMVGWFKM